jgi:hypothetical protein
LKPARTAYIPESRETEISEQFLSILIRWIYQTALQPSSFKELQLKRAQIE